MSRKKKIKDKSQEILKSPAITPQTESTLPETVGKERIRVSGHYIDQKLKYATSRQEQLDLFEILETETLETIPETEISTTVIGIPLTPTQDKFIQSCLNLLYKKSNTNIDQKNSPAEPDKFYRGNLPTTQRRELSMDKKIPAIIITPHELYKEYAQSNDYSGETINIVQRTQDELTQKRWLMVYKRKRIDNSGRNLVIKTDKVEEYQPLLRLIKYSVGLTENEDKLLDKNPSQMINEKTKFVIYLHPIFVDQLETKFILTPPDISKRTEIASGGAHKVTEAINCLRDYLLRALSNKTYEVVIDKSKLPEILRLQGYIKNGRKKLITQRVENSIQAVKNLGLATEVNEICGKKQQPQYQFILNKDF